MLSNAFVVLWFLSPWFIGITSAIGLVVILWAVWNRFRR